MAKLRRRPLQSEIYFPIIVFIHLIFWVIDLKTYSGDYKYTNQHVIGEIFSSWVVTVFAFNFLMATRARWVERLFGGLDKMYLIHRRSGKIAVVLLILHFIVVPKTAEFHIGKPMGVISLLLILIGVFVSATPALKRKFPYDKWRFSHKLMGFFYCIGVAHAFNVPSLTFELPIVRTYVFGMAAIGIVSWIYRVFLYGFIIRISEYQTTKVQKLPGDVLEITMSPSTPEAKLKHIIGQFAFFSIEGQNRGEPHPFTISSHPSDPELRITVKSLGDYTSRLQDTIKPGMKVKVDGPFGLFSPKHSRYKKQIWIAGGIGITPFLSFIKDDLKEMEVTFIWSIPNSDLAFYKQEIEDALKLKPHIQFRHHSSKKDGHFSIDANFNVNDLSNCSIMFCGPVGMLDKITDQCMNKGVALRDIHYEEFTFR